MNEQLIRQKWRSHVKHSKARGVKPLPLHDYSMKLIEDGISPEQIGRTKGSYQLSRYTDQGDYTVDSCRFIPQTENLRERTLNGGTERGASKRRGASKETDPGCAKISTMLRGRSAKTHAYIARIAAKKGKPFSFVSPNGEIHAGSNLREFCRKNGLCRVSLRMVMNGKYQAYKGWKRAGNGQ